jgi:peptidoglycan/LPS O-acetylase OafA/YrhL
MFGFMLGNFAYRCHEHLKAGWMPSIGTEVAAAFIFLILFWFDPVNSFLTLCAFGVVVFLFSFERGPVSKVLNGKVFLFLGKISYSIYLIHYVILSVLYGVLRILQSHFHEQYLFHLGQSDMIKIGPTYLMDCLAIAYVVAVVTGASLCYSFIEEPGRELFNRVSRRLSNFRPSTQSRQGI